MNDSITSGELHPSIKKYPLMTGHFSSEDRAIDALQKFQPNKPAEFIKNDIGLLKDNLQIELEDSEYIFLQLEKLKRNVHRRDVTMSVQKLLIHIHQV